MTDETRNNFIDIFMALPVWDQQEALESLGINLKLSDAEQIEIAGLKASREKAEELKEAKETKVRTKEFMDNMVKGMDFKDSWDNLFKIRK